MSDVSASGRFFGVAVPSDTVERKFKALYCNEGGVVTVMPAQTEGNAAPVPVAFTVNVGTYLCIVGSHIMSTGTTANNIIWMNW